MSSSTARKLTTMRIFSVFPFFVNSLKLNESADVIRFVRSSTISSRLMTFRIMSCGIISCLGRFMSTFCIASRIPIFVISFVGVNIGIICRSGSLKKSMCFPKRSSTWRESSLIRLYFRSRVSKSSMLSFSSSVSARYGRSERDFMRTSVEAIRIKCAASRIGNSLSRSIYER